MSGENLGAYLNQGDGNVDDLQDAEYSQSGCCFCLPFSRRPSSDRASTSAVDGGGFWDRAAEAVESGEDSWWVRGWKKMREWSEIVAGPRWKTFIRRFRKNRRQGNFGYDPLSYAMNFDEGQNGNYRDEDCGFRDFSSRYAVIPASAKSSMDLGKDGPSFW